MVGAAQFETHPSVRSATPFETARYFPGPLPVATSGHGEGQGGAAAAVDCNPFTAYHT